MDLLLILTYVSLCYLVFKVFKVPVNQWTVTTAGLIGIVLIAGLMVIMAYCHPYSEAGRHYFKVVPIVSDVKGVVTKVVAEANIPMKKGDIIYEIDSKRYEANVKRLRGEVEYNRQRYEEAKKLYDADAGRLYEVQKYKLAVDQLEASLTLAELDLERTKVRAPTDGLVTQLGIEEGMMSVPLPLKPLVTFIPNNGNQYGAAFRQVAIASIEPGFEVEAAFKAIPGRVFRGEVKAILPVMAEGQISGQGVLRVAQKYKEEGRYLVTFDLGEDIEAYKLPKGSALSVAVYSDKVEPAGMVRKILIRMLSWQNYFNFELH